jgi:hypothetical protein
MVALYIVYGKSITIVKPRKIPTVVDREIAISESDIQQIKLQSAVT